MCRGEPWVARATVGQTPTRRHWQAAQPRVFPEDSMFGTSTRSTTEIGTHAWMERTGGALTAQERRQLLGPLALTHAVNAAGRLSMLVRLNWGRRATGTLRARPRPDSALTRKAEALARHRLSPAVFAG
jgi:hypothetical protein